MKNIRKVLVSAIVIIGVFSCAFYLSCKKKCGSTVCQNGGTCAYSDCVCPLGYSGNACQTGWSDEFIGTYVCIDSQCIPAIPNTGTWQSSITKDANNSGYTVDISHFDGASNVTVVGTVDSAGNLTVSPAAGAGGIHAYGQFVNDTIRIQFTTSAVYGTTFTCKMVLAKQG